MLAPTLYLVILLLALSGCALAPSDAYINALAGDKASACVAVTTPYGGIITGRANSPGVRVSIQGATCTIERSAETPTAR